MSIKASAAILVFLTAPLLAQEPPAKRIRASRPLALYSAIDSPNAEVLDYGGFAFSSRFFNKGGLLPSVSFGVFQRLMLGASLQLDNYIGHGNIDLQRPELQMKFRFYDGDRYLPAAAIGYDSQGYRYDKITKEYGEPERGLYLALTQEVLWRGLEWTAGANVSDFEQDSIRAFTNLTWVPPGGMIAFLAEYDNIHHTRWNRLNGGANLFLSPFVQMGFHVRDILGRQTHQNSSDLRRPERIIDVRYLTSF
ncbi:MAG: hypothetical protein HYT79_10925 [Elusimicrobia bacterium]|nr:hypothetical protein [Elusimicrobiota bacterium]